MIKLKDVADAFDEINEGWAIYLDKETGEIIYVPDDNDFIDEEEFEENLEKINSDTEGRFVALPDQFEINEFQIMVYFAESLSNQKHIEKLTYALRGRKPFRNFKDTIRYLDIAEDYYAFRSAELKAKAERWLEDNDIPYSE